MTGVSKTRAGGSGCLRRRPFDAVVTDEPQIGKEKPPYWVARRITTLAASGIIARRPPLLFVIFSCFVFFFFCLSCVWDTGSVRKVLPTKCSVVEVEHMEQQQQPYEGYYFCIPRSVNLRAIGGAQPELHPCLHPGRKTRRVGDALSSGFLLGLRGTVFNCLGEDLLGKRVRSLIRQLMLRSRSFAYLTSSITCPPGSITAHT